jgi:hypothetical protein
LSAEFGRAVIEEYVETDAYAVEMELYGVQLRLRACRLVGVLAKLGNETRSNLVGQVFG